MWFAGIWSLLGLVPCCWLAAVKTGRLRKARSCTSETIGRRFESKMLQTVIAIIMLYFLFMYSVGQLKAAGGVWHATTGLPAVWCLLLSIFIAWLYMVLGGYVGTQWSMAFQGAFLGFVGALPGIWAIIWAGGFVRRNLSKALYGAQGWPGAYVKLMRSRASSGGSDTAFQVLSVSLLPRLSSSLWQSASPHNVSRFLGMGTLNKRGYWTLITVVFVIAGIPIMLDCSSNGLVARMIYGSNLLKIKPWCADLAAPALAYAVGGVPMMTLYTMGSFRCCPIHPCWYGVHYERQYHP